MKQTRYLLTIVLFALAIPAGLAQDGTPHKAKHHHYKLIDIGTFGGPQSAIPDNSGFQTTILNNHGVLIGGADTSLPDPFPNFCFDPDCFISHAFKTSRGGELTDLGVLPGGASSMTQWISRNGLITGVSENGQTDPLLPGVPELHAVLWQDDGITDLGTLEGGYESIPSAVNSRGEVVGMFTNTTPDPNSMFGSGYQTRAFFWKDGMMQDLGTVGTGTDAWALLNNDRGEVVGFSYVSSVPINCGAFFGGTLALGSFIWDQENGMRDLGGLGGLCTEAEALNNRGHVVGVSDFKGDATAHAFVWDGSIHDLGGSLGGTFTNALALNDSGEVVGAANLAGDVLFHAVLWRRIGKLTDLGVLSGDLCSFAESINAKSQVVGESVADCVNIAGFRPFLWEDGSIFDLNALIPPGSPLVLQFAQTINDRGEIAGNGVDANGNNHAFLLIPCDEYHPDVESCGYSVVDTKVAASVRATMPHASGNVAAAENQVFVPITQQPQILDPRNSIREMLLRRFGPTLPVLRPRAGSAPESEAIPSTDSALQPHDLVWARDRAEITADLGLTSNFFYCPRPRCSSRFQTGRLCGCVPCFHGFCGLHRGYDLTYKRACNYEYGRC